MEYIFLFMFSDITSLAFFYFFFFLWNEISRLIYYMCESFVCPSISEQRFRIKEEERGQFGAVRWKYTLKHLKHLKHIQSLAEIGETGRRHRRSEPSDSSGLVLGPARAAEEIAAGRLVRNGDAAAVWPTWLRRGATPPWLSTWYRESWWAKRQENPIFLAPKARNKVYFIN